MAKTTKELLMDIDARISHIEDICADNRQVIIKLVKQSNKIVEFLRDLEFDAVAREEELMLEDMNMPSYTIENNTKPTTFKALKELIDEFMDKREELEEFEKELKEHKEKLTPGIIGES